MQPLDRSKKIYVAGHRGLVGSALVRKLQKEGFTNIITRTHAELDLKCESVHFWKWIARTVVCFKLC